MVGSAASRALSRIGQDVDVINFTKTGEDDYGENFAKDDPIRTKGRVGRASGVGFLGDALAFDPDLDVAIYVEDSVTIKREGGGEHATRVDVDLDGDAEYVVVSKQDQGSGLYRLDCRRRTEG